jgi:hypothetical protein
MGLEPRYGWPKTLPLIAMYVSVIFFMFLRFEPVPIDTYNYWREVSEATVRPGDTVVITTTVEVTKDGCNATLERRWFDTAGNLVRDDFLDLPETDIHLGSVARDAVIPEIANGGILRMSAGIEFRCNFVQDLFGGSTHVMPNLYFVVKA